MPVYAHLDDDYAAIGLGSRVREQRKRRGWTLAELASRLSLSVGTLSAIENEKVAIDLDQLLAMSSLFDVPFDALLPRSTARQFYIARRGQLEAQPALPMKVINRTTHSLVSYHNKLWPLAKPFIGKHLEPFEIEVQPIADSERRFIAHNHEEFVFVLDGRIQCQLKTPDGLIERTLGPGDCIYFWCYLPHCIRSITSESARTIHVEYSPHQLVDVEYGISGSGTTIYMVDPGQENLNVQIAGKLSALRRARGMSLAQFGQETGISVNRLRNIESARGPISLDMLLRFCRIFQKPKEYFLTYSLIERPFFSILRARELRQMQGRTHPAVPGECACCTKASYKPLANGFPKRGMHPYVVTLQHPSGRPGPLRQHRGQEFVYVLRGSVKFTVAYEDGTADDVLMPGDACFLNSSAPHAFGETRVSPYGTSHAEMLVVRCPSQEHFDDAVGNGHLPAAPRVRKQST